MFLPLTLLERLDQVIPRISCLPANGPRARRSILLERSLTLQRVMIYTTLPLQMQQSESRGCDQDRPHRSYLHSMRQIPRPGKLSVTHEPSRRVSPMRLCYIVKRTIKVRLRLGGAHRMQNVGLLQFAHSFFAVPASFRAGIANSVMPAKATPKASLARATIK